MTKLIAGFVGVVVGFGACAEEDPGAIQYATVRDVLEALRAEPTAQFEMQQGWVVVASSEGGRAVQWFFTPEGHPAHPAAVKRVAVEENGIGMIELAAVCHAAQSACDQLLDDFRQQHLLTLESDRAQRVELDVGIAVNDHGRVAVKRLVAEEGQAAEIRVESNFKMVIVPTLGEQGSVMFWTAMYEYDGREFVLVGPPQLASPFGGTAHVEMASHRGNRFGFSITPLLVARE